MGTINKISTIEAIALVLIVCINRLILYLPQNILLSSGSSAVLNVIYISIIAIILTFIFVKLCKRFCGLDIIDVSEFLGGKVFKNIVGIFIVLYIIFLSSMLIREFSEVIHILYYKNAAVIYILISFIIVSAVANLISSHSIVRTNLFLCLIMVVSLLVCFASVVPNMTYQRIFPLLGNGAYTTFVSGLCNLVSFNGLIVLYLVPSMLKEPKPESLNKIAIISVVITAILILLATGCLLLSFSFTTELENISPLYLLISNNHFGEYFQHPESLFILVWILAFMTYLNVSIMLVIQTLKKITNVKNVKPFVIPLCIIVLIIAMIPQSFMDVRNINIEFSKYIAAPTVFVIFPLILILANIKKRRVK